jgi:hypothetical protein
MSDEEKRTRQQEEKPMDKKSMYAHLPNVCSKCKGTGRVGRRGRYGRKIRQADYDAREAKQRAEEKQNG